MLPNIYVKWTNVSSFILSYNPLLFGEYTCLRS